MKESIYTIPISEIFEPKDGCPLCRMRELLEQRAVEYILGAAMMEPDVREETNRLGFCFSHYSQMLERKNRLQMALTLQTRLQTLLGELENPTVPPKHTSLKIGSVEISGGAPETLSETCYVCSMLEREMTRARSNIYQMYSAHPEFRTLYSEQTGLCYAHCRFLLDGASALSSGLRKEFAGMTAELCTRHLQPLYEEISNFCSQFDYRNAGNSGFGTSRNSIERSVQAITGYIPDSLREKHKI